MKLELDNDDWDRILRCLEDEMYVCTGTEDHEEAEACKRIYELIVTKLGK